MTRRSDLTNFVFFRIREWYFRWFHHINSHYTCLRSKMSVFWSSFTKHFSTLSQENSTSFSICYLVILNMIQISFYYRIIPIWSQLKHFKFVNKGVRRIRSDWKIIFLLFFAKIGAMRIMLHIKKGYSYWKSMVFRLIWFN